MLSRQAHDRGSVTAEFAVVLPAVVLVLVAALCTLQLASQQLRLQDAAAAASRVLARGDQGGAARASAIAPGSHISRSDHDGLVCVTADLRSAGGGMLGLVTLSATSCALGGGQ